jgi:hypothetical protein
MQSKTAAIIQPFGIGDCIWSQTIAHRFMKAGYNIIWPVLPQFVEGLQRAYPDITWLNAYDQKKVDLNTKVQKVIDGILHVPIRWSVDIMGVPYSQCMSSKYDMYGWDWRIWKDHAMWKRDEAKEKALFYDVLKLKDGDEFILTNKYYRSDLSGIAPIPVFEEKTVEMKRFMAYSIFDWAFTLERAKEIHVVSSAILYMLEMLELKQPIHLYTRLPEESDFRNVEFLFSKRYHTHL